MEYINDIAEEDELKGSFIYEKAIRLFEHYNPTSNREYIAKVCYWLCSNLEPLYDGDSAFELTPIWDVKLSKEENKRIKRDVERKVVSTCIEIIVSCNGDIIEPKNNNKQVIVMNNMIKINSPVIGCGSYGEVYLIDGLAVKAAPWGCLCVELSALLRETVALAKLGRIKFIGMNNDCYYVGMEYYTNKLTFDTPKQTMEQLLTELKHIHSLGIIHCDIKVDNIRIDSNGNAKLIDFGCCRFTPAVKASTHIGTPSYRDYLLHKTYVTDYSYEIDIWSLGIVFYIIEKRKTPWGFMPTIEKEWDNALDGVSDIIKRMLSLSKDDRYVL